MAATFNYFDFVKGATAASYPTTNRAESILQGRTAIEQGNIQFDSSYPTGGYPASKFGMQTLNFVAFMHPPGYVISYNSSTDKVQVYDNGAGAGTFAEVANATNLSALQAVGFFALGLW